MYERPPVARFELHSQNTLWVGATNGLPYRLETDGEPLGVSTDPATGETTPKAVETVTDSTILFDTNLKVEPPAL